MWQMFIWMNIEIGNRSQGSGSRFPKLKNVFSISDNCDLFTKIRYLYARQVEILGMEVASFE